MDITNESLKSMKAKQLRRLIREAIEEVLNEDAAADKKAQDTAKMAAQAQLQALQKKKASLSSATTISPVNKPAHDAEKLAVDKKIAVVAKKLQSLNKPGLSSVELDEMARLAKGFRLADPNFNASQYANKRVSGTSLADVINFFRENPGAEKSQLQSQFNFVRPQIANAVVNALLDAGVLVKLSASGEEETPVAPGEEQPETIDGPESFLIGSGDPLAGMFDGEPNDDGSEDFNDEEEPTTGEVEPGTPATTGGMSDDDYEAFMKYKDLTDRLAATKSNLLKIRRKKGGTAGDISDRPSTEEQRLRDLKKSLEDRISALVDGSTYLQKKVEKETGKTYEPIEVEPEEEEDTIDEAYDAEYEKRKLQFYAGIIK
jgi:hypothetical protein